MGLGFPVAHFFCARTNSLGGGYEKSKELAGFYKALAGFMKLEFLTAGDHVSTDGVDDIHFTAGTNMRLGHVIAAKVETLF